MFGNEKRFEKVSQEGHLWGNTLVIMDKETGVHYLCGISGSGEGITAITPLLDENGKVAVSKD